MATEYPAYPKSGYPAPAYPAEYVSNLLSYVQFSKTLENKLDILSGWYAIPVRLGR